jgi:hypothetical protein
LSNDPRRLDPRVEQDEPRLDQDDLDDRLDQDDRDRGPS